MTTLLLPIIITIIAIACFVYASRTAGGPRIALLAGGIVFGIFAVSLWFGFRS